MHILKYSPCIFIDETDHNIHNNVTNNPHGSFYNKQQGTEVRQKFYLLYWEALTVGAWQRSTARAAVFFSKQVALPAPRKFQAHLHQGVLFIFLPT